MNRLLTTMSACVLLGCGVASAAQSGQPLPAASLTAPQGPTAPVDARGFLHRWMVLEPVPVAGRLTESAVQEALQAAPLALPVDAMPRDGESIPMNGAMLAWHALDTRNYNLNLYHFAWAISKPTSNVLFWVTTVVDSPQELHDVRLAIGSNAASRWWLNGVPVIALNDDRQTVIDDGISKRVTLHAGRNVIRAAIINGGGATDFCARFLDEDDRPIAGLTTTLEIH